MNQGMFKLVYSKVFNMYVPASEAVRSHGAKNSRRVRKHAKGSLSILIISAVYASNVYADTATSVSLQKAVNAVVNSTVNSTTVHQTAPKAILDWNKLNIGKNYLLKFDQQGNRNWSALNRIHDLSPTIFNGRIQADGNVFFINTNGIIFGENAQFNVGSLYAGTLDITDDLFNEGILSKPFKPVFEGVGGFVMVEDGAQLKTASGGKVMLFSPTVENNGVITTPDGQTILAAGKKVYLQSSTDPAGFMVEVDGGGTATNLGKIIAERGNITMMGLAVNQAGSLTATTSVRANGSIYLKAANTVLEQPTGLVATREGVITLAKGSVTEVVPEYANKEETIASQAFKTSEVKIEGSLVNIDGKISAKGGNVTVKTVNDFPADKVAEVNAPVDIKQRIYLGDNAEIDVSGVDAIAPMSRNQLEIQLYSDQLKDAPILRDGGLFKETVYVDARKGTDLFDIKPFLDLKGVTVAEKMTKAGSITLSTPNDLIVSKGAKLDVSGGSTNYEAGSIRETNLHFNGKLVAISEAKAGVPYDKTADVYTVKDDKWGVTRAWDLNGGGTAGWGKATNGSANTQLKTTIAGSQVAAYFEGDDAGKLDLGAPKNLVLAGQVLANTKVSKEQRINQSVPKSGQFLASANHVTIEAQSQQLPGNFVFENLLPDSDNYQSAISTDFLAQGFNRVTLSSTTKPLEVNANMQLKPNGELTLSKSQINADIIAPGSNITFAGNSVLVDGVTVSTAGTFTNDKSSVQGALTQDVAINGGKITTTVGNNKFILGLDDNTKIDASAGAWVDSEGVLHTGSAGDIEFTAGNYGDNVQLKSYGFNKGGALKVGFTKTLNIAGDENASNADIDIDASFFKQAGFSKYDLTSSDINVGDSTKPQELYTAAKTWDMNSGFVNQAGGQSMSSVASTVLQADHIRKPVSISLTAGTGGVLTLAENTTIRTDNGGNVSLNAGKQVNVLGSVITPSGNIAINIRDADPSLAYDPTQAVFIGENAKLSATGTRQELPDSRANLIKAQVFNAGNITISAQDKGVVVIKNGAVLDVSGTSVVNDTKTSNGYVRETLHGDAGTISLSARDGLMLDGQFKGEASGTGRDGTLNLALTNPSFAADPASPYPFGSREFTITQHKELKAQNFSSGDALKTTAGNAFTELSTDALKAQVSVDQIKSGGFANVSIKSDFGRESGVLKDSIQLASGLDLNVAGNLKLETPLINVQDNGTAKISASHIALVSPNVIQTPKVNGANLAASLNSIATGTGTLSTQSKQLYVSGLMAVAGVNKTAVKTSLDIHGQGGLVANGEVDLTARQIYPNTNTQLGFQALGNDSKVIVNSNGQATKPVLSAEGILSIKADNIVQNGVLSAPFGQIDLDANKSVTLTAASTTSISANNQNIPYSTTGTGGENYIVLNANGDTTLLDKHINIKSTKVDLQKNATVDLSAGGDMFAYEWVPGIGGTKDILAQENTYAVMPSLGNNYAAYDQVYAESSATVKTGETVFLTGIPGLATGTYTLLPARYALVPGAFLVEANVSSKLLPTQVAPQLDGSTLTTGYRSELATGARDANWSTFRVTNGSIFRPAAGAVNKAQSQYILTSANTYFANPNKTDGKKVSLPIDVGRLGLDAASKLNLESQIVANKAAGGSGLQVDISSDNIRVVSSVGADDGSLQLTATGVNALNAESVLLGGKRELKNGVVEVTTSASSVSIENDSSHHLKTPELIATASDTITVKTGAVVDTGEIAEQVNKTTLNANRDGALVALSSINDITFTRTGASATATTGALNVEAGSTLKAGKSIVLDATKSGSLAGNLALKDGGSATLGANRILLGDTPAAIAGLNVNAAILAGLGKLNKLALNSYSNVDTFGKVDFGNKNLDLTINAAGIAGHLANGETLASVGASPQASVITAKNFTLKNTSGATFETPTDASGRGLEINAGTAEVKSGNTVVQEKIVGNVNFVGKEVSDTSATSGKTEIAGFTQLNIKADEVRVAKQGETNFNIAQTTVTTGRITADTAADYKVKADKFEITKLAGAKISAGTGLGAKLAIQANDLKVGGTIDVASGKLALTASNDLNLVDGAILNAKSTHVTFYDKTIDAPAGSINLTSTTGNVNVNAGAVVDVSSDKQANAGLVKVAATSGTANIAGELKGAAVGGGKGGALEVDVKTLADLSATNKQAIGFDESRQYRVRSGDVNISGAGADALTTREAIVSADVGKIIVTGEIIATAPKNSRIGLFAGNGVTLENTAILKANSTKAGENGGKVEINTLANQLDFKAGSSIDVSGGAGGAGGEVTMRAPRTADNKDINIADMSTTITGAKKIQAEGFKVYDKALIPNANIATADQSKVLATGFYKEAETFMKSVIANNAFGLGRLGIASDSMFTIVPGVEVRNSTGNLTVSNDWSLHDWRFDSTTGAGVTTPAQLASGLNADGKTLLPGVLTLLASGDVLVNGTLSDGFSNATTGTTTTAVAQGLESWAYRIVAGADFSAANVLATNATTGNVSIANAKGIRTGTGDINIAAGVDVKMGTGSAIYTAGRNASTLDDFDAPASPQKPLYLTDGGDITIDVQGNIVGKEPASSRQLINNWLFRQGGGSTNKDTSWWVRPDLFQQSLATLGGGDINIQAAGSISNFSASAPTTARFDSNGTTGNQTIDGGGDLSIKAGADINNGVYFVAKGDGDIRADGSIQKQGLTFGTTLAVQDGNFNVSAGKSAYIETIINPTLLNQSTTNASPLDVTGTSAHFNTYADTAKVNISSLLGNVDFDTNAVNTVSTKVTGLNTNTGVWNSLNLYPSKLNVTAFSGDITAGGTASAVTLLPSSTGDLKLLAANNINISNITMSDADPSLLPSVNNPSSAKDFPLAVTQLKTHATQLLHKSDADPSMVVAQNGNIVGAANYKVTLAEAAKFVAGSNIDKLVIDVQNNNQSDITLLKAGNDILIGTTTVSGPGNVLVQAGRNIDLSKTSAKITTTGNAGNVALPSEGASLTLQAGLGKGANVQGYIDQYISPTGVGPSVLKGDAAGLVSYHSTTTQALTAYMRNTTGNSVLTDADALTQFNALNLEAKTIFVNRHLTSELIASGKQFNTTGEHDRAYAAIASLFPTKNEGDILLFKSKITTNSGGSIDLLAPGGFINVGVAGGASEDVGVITEKGGAIRAIADHGFEVNQSKVITQFGSDITVWSTKGTIDAGRGSKTATSIPERIVLTDADGNTTVEVKGVAAGSGIRAQSYDPDGLNGPNKEPDKGTVTLIAPTVDAGEAGIEAGDIAIFTDNLVNGANIQVQGASSGTQTTAAASSPTAPAGLSPDSVNSVVAQVAQSVSQSANQTFEKPSMPSIISVDVIGIGM